MIAFAEDKPNSVEGISTKDSPNLTAQAIQISSSAWGELVVAFVKE
jgi:hypothetical protein